MHLTNNSRLPAYGRRASAAAAAAAAPPPYPKPQWLPQSGGGGPQRSAKKSIKSLNIYCLSKIFNNLDYGHLVDCRLVCRFWKECVDYHLKRRTHFTFTPKLNALRPRRNDGDDGDDGETLSPPQEQSALSSSPLPGYCRQCHVLNQMSIAQVEAQQQQQQQSPPPQVSTIDHQNVIKCGKCQLDEQQQQVRRRQQQQQQQLLNANKINIQVLEMILPKLPNLRVIKLAEGYRYGRLQQNCLDVSATNLIGVLHAHCPQLTHIDLANCTGLGVGDFEQLVAYYGRQLRVLNVSGARIDEACLRILVKGMDQLWQLNVANNFCNLQGACFEWLAEGIESLVLDYNQNVRSLDGVLLGKGKHIVELDVNVGFCFNPAMPYKLIGYHFQNLISLRITFKSFGKRQPKIFEHLAELKELECLYLLEEIDDFDSESFLDDDSILIILGSVGESLRELYLHAASSLFSGDSALTDVAIGHLDRLCPMLEVFSIKGASITDRGLEAIGRLNYARVVELIDLKYITKEGIRNVMWAFKQIETRELKQCYETTGIDLKVRDDGPQISSFKKS